MDEGDLIPTKSGNNQDKVAAKSSLRLPLYAWFLIVGAAVAVVVLAIVLPLVLIKPAGIPPAPPASISPTTVPTENYPALDPKAITYQTLVPPLSGIMKNAATILYVDSATQTVAFLLSGRNSTSALFVAHFTSGIIQTAFNLGSTTWATVQDINTQLVILKTTDNPTWKACTTNTCSTLTWANTALIDDEFFLSPIWSETPGNLMVSFEKTGAQYQITVQTGSTVYNDLNTVVPGLLTPLSSSIICLLSSSGESYLTVAIPEYFTNQIVYFTYTDTITSPVVQKLSVTDLIYADMSDNGLWLLVLRTDELQLFSRPNSNALFTLADSVVFNPRVSPQVCALDRTSPANMWCTVGTTLKYIVLVSVNTSTGKFDANTGRLLPSKYLQSTDGLPIAITLVPTANSVFVLMADNLGNVENVVFQDSLQ